MQDSRPQSVAVGHLNNDMWIDIVVANSGTDNIGIFRGYGDGTFANQETYSTGSGSQPYSVAVGDFNNDNWLDIAVANHGSNSIGILIANGNGTFAAVITFSLGSSRSVSITIADFNNDKRLDIVVANYDTSDVGVLLGYGNGSFAIPMRFTTGYDSLPCSVAVGDFNGDSHLDIVVANSGTSNIGVFLGYGNGSFGIQNTFTTGRGSVPYFAAIGDFNGDNRLDIAVANYGSDSIGIYLGYDDGSFATVIAYAIGSGSGPYSLAVGHFYNDKTLDIAVSNSNNDTVVVLRGLGNGDFVNKEIHSLNTGSNPLSIAVGYFDNNNRLDIVVVNNDNNNIDVLIRSIRNPFAIQTLYSTGNYSQPFNVATGDLNNDNQLDIIVANSDSSNVGVLLGYGNGSFEYQMTFTTGIYTVPYSVALGDFNSDNRLDVAVANSQINNVGVFLGLGNGSLATQTTYSMGNGSLPHSVAVGDFNNDHRLDIVVANRGTDNIGVLLGHGNGTFEVPKMYSTGNQSSPIMVAVGDLNKDNMLDIVVANLNTGNVGVLLGYGNGSFENLTTYSNGCIPRSVVIRDFNNDNILDIAVANTQCDNVGILLGYGDGKFREEMAFSTGSVTDTYWLGVDDFNQDNQLDIVAVNFDSSDLSVLFGYGNGSFLLATAYSIGASSRPSSITVGDFNNDSLPDIAIPYYYGDNVGVFLGNDDSHDALQTIYSTGSSAHPHSVVVTYLNNDTNLDMVIANSGNQNVGVRLGYGNGTFAIETTYSSGANFLPQYATIGDFNKDNQVDIAVANILNDSINVFLGFENGTFGNPGTYATGDGSQPYWISVADFNNDSRLDLAVANSGTNNVGVFLGYNTVTFNRQKPSSCGLGVSPQFFVVRDFNNDNRLDIAVADFNNHDVGIHLGYGDGTFAPQKIYLTGSNAWPCSIAAADFNNDSQLDLVVTNCYSDNVGVFLGHGDGTFGSQKLYSTGNGSVPAFVAVGDFNSDNRLDIVVANYGTDNLSIFLGYGNGTFSMQATYSTGYGSSPNFIVVGDLNSDNNLDIVVANSGSNNIGILCGYGNGTFSIQMVYSTGNGSVPYAVDLGDMNDDNRLDIVVTNSGTDNVGILLGNGNGTFANQLTYPTGNGSSPLGVAIADFNNDSLLDITVANYDTSNVGVLFGNGNGYFMEPITFSVGNQTNPIAVFFGDFNGDYRLDIIVLNLFPGNAMVFLSESAYFLSQLVYSTGENSNPQSIAVGDFNDDHHPDIVVANYGSNNVAILLGHGDGTFGNAMTYQTGIDSHPCSVVVGDMNNDTRLDLVVANAGSGSVGVLYGYGNGNFSNMTTLPTGIASIPHSVAVSDFNNDNCSDIVVVNYGNNNLIVIFGYCNETFGKENSYPLGYGSGLYSLAVGDFNNDSWMDIAVAMDGYGFVDVLLQKC